MPVTSDASDTTDTSDIIVTIVTNYIKVQDPNSDYLTKKHLIQ
jgi:hypothetical protein